MKPTILFGSIAAVTVVGLAACSGDAAVDTSATAAPAGSSTTTTVSGDATGSSNAKVTTSTVADRSTATTSGSTATTSGSTATTSGSTATEPSGNQPPSALITAPVHLSNHQASFSGGRFGATINFTSIAVDPDGDSVTVEWFSSLEGFLGTGKNLTTTIHTGASDSSQPFITVRVTDQWGRSSEHQIQVVVWIPSTTG